MAQLRHLVVQVPGIGGSVLADTDGRRSWDVSVRRIGHTLVQPEVLGLDRHLVPDRLIDTTTIIPPVLVMPGYDTMLHHLRTHLGAGLTVTDYRPGVPVPAGTDVLRVPYDFRRSVREAAGLLDRAVFDALGPPTDDGRKVIVLAHSMGGLVARYWVGPLHGWRYCHALLSLGTPHRGAPRALDWLVNGVGIGRWRHRRATRVLRGWPSVYELLPQYPAVRREDGSPLEPVDLPPSCVRVFDRRDADAPATVLRMAGEGARTHEEIAAGWAEIPEGRRPEIVPYFGRGHATLNLARLTHERVRVTKEDPEWRGNVGWRGDGTVPTISAIPTELNERRTLWRAVPDTHGPMGSTPAVVELLTSLMGEKLPGRGNLRPERPWVGLDLDEVVPAGAEVRLGATVLAGEAGGEPARASGGVVAVALADPTAGAGRVEVSLVGDGAGWRAVLPPLPEGLYEITVEVKGGWYGTSVYASAPLAVVEAADEDLVPDDAPDGEAGQ